MNELNINDMTPLVVAAQAGHRIVCQRLLNLGAGIASLGTDQWPPLLVELLTKRESVHAMDTTPLQADAAAADEALGMVLAEDLERSVDVSHSLWASLLEDCD